MKINLKTVRTWGFLQTLVLCLVLSGLNVSSSRAEGICVADSIHVAAVSGKVLIRLDKGETPLDEAIVTLKKGNDAGRVVAAQPISKNGEFHFQGLKAGRYQLSVTAPGLSDFYLDLRLRRSKVISARTEIVVVMGTDFEKPCSGSFAELRRKEAQ